MGSIEGKLEIPVETNKDTERLDFIEKRGMSVLFDTETGWDISSVQGRVLADSHDSARDAIDEVMASEEVIDDSGSDGK